MRDEEPESPPHGEGSPPGPGTEIVPNADRSGQPRTPTAILCPRCSLTLIESNARSHYGAKLVLEHCPRCGGHWTTWGKLLALSLECVLELKSQAHGPECAVPALSRIPCPHCGEVLARIGSADFPPEVKAPDDMTIYPCPAGHGLWLDGSEAARFKRFQAEILEKKREKYSEEKAFRARFLGERTLGADRIAHASTRMMVMAFAFVFLTALSCLLWLFWGPPLPVWPAR